MRIKMAARKMLLPHCVSRPINTFPTSISPSSYINPLTNSSSHIFSPSYFKPISKSYSISRSMVISADSIVAKTPPVNLDKDEEESVFMSEWNGLKEMIKAGGIDFGVYTPGPYTYLMCSKCKGGKSMIRTLSFHVNQHMDFAMWRCFNFECGWAGQVLAEMKPTSNDINNLSEVKIVLPRQLTERNLRLEPPGEEVIAFFADRMISKKTLQRNGVMQTSNDEIAIAFTYRRHGLIVNCKYRSINSKRFWQEKGAEKILYGVDGIKDSDEIIIVEGETDKLSMEEAGIFNSVSVPNGAPQGVSKRKLPPMELDTRFNYIWNCKEYLDKASRIILATDADRPGQALAEELARRLGRERCWLVTWPKKDELGPFKDANDVLKNLGADALRDIIENAKPYEMQNSIEAT